jgi:hypothetical protein
MNLDTEDLTLVNGRSYMADILILGCTIFVFGWIATALVWLANV